MQEENVAIFWDFETARVKSRISGYDVAKGLRQVANTFGALKSFRVYLDVACQSHPGFASLRKELHSSGVSILDCPSYSRKDVADKAMIVDMLTLMIDQPPPYTIVIATGDCDISYALAILRSRRYKVVLVHPPSVHESLLMQADHTASWYSQVLGVNEDDGSSSSSSPSSPSSSTSSSSSSSSDSPHQPNLHQATSSARPRAHKPTRSKISAANTVPPPGATPQYSINAGYRLRGGEDNRPTWDFQGGDGVNSTFPSTSVLQSPRNPRLPLFEPGVETPEKALPESTKSDSRPQYHLPPASRSPPKEMIDPAFGASGLLPKDEEKGRLSSRSSGSFSIVGHPSPKPTGDAPISVPTGGLDVPTPSVSAPDVIRAAGLSQVIPSTSPLATPPASANFSRVNPIPELPMAYNEPPAVADQVVTPMAVPLAAVPFIDDAAGSSPTPHITPAATVVPLTSTTVAPSAHAPITAVPSIVTPVKSSTPLSAKKRKVNISTPTPVPVPTTQRAKPAPVASAQGASSNPAAPSTSQPSATPIPPPIVPEPYRLLVRLLQQYRRNGDQWPSQSVIAAKIIHDNPNFYKTVKATKWRDYANSAVTAGIVTKAGEWISLNSKWVGAVVP